MGELGTDLARGGRSLDGVAPRARAREERIPSDGGLRVVQEVRLFHRVSRPRRVVALRVRDDRDEHVGMAVAAELEALSFVCPRLVRLDPERGVMSRHRVLLAAEVRDPERVDDVLRCELQLDLLTDRDIELLAGLKRSTVLKLEGRR